MVKHVYRIYIYTLFIHTNEFICIPRVFAMATVHFWAQVQIASRPPSRAGPRRLELGWTSSASKPSWAEKVGVGMDLNRGD